MAKVTKNKNITFRTRGNLKDRLGAAADEYGRSLSEEVEHRLEMSFQYEERLAELQKRVRDLELRADEDRKTISRQSTANELAAGVLASTFVKIATKNGEQALSDQHRDRLFDRFREAMFEGMMREAKKLEGASTDAPSSEQSEGGDK
jgi:hypothetical protein